MSEPGRIEQWLEPNGDIIYEHHGDTSRIAVGGYIAVSHGWDEFFYGGDMYRVVEGPLCDESGNYRDEYIVERIFLV